jgi:hypothetical protein
MPKKKGLGRDINASVEIMDDLLGCLSKFHDMPLKRGLKSNKMYEDDVAKVVNDAMNKAFALRTIVEDLRNEVSGMKPKTDTSKRFASQRVISKFLSLD